MPSIFAETKKGTWAQVIAIIRGKSKETREQEKTKRKKRPRKELVRQYIAGDGGYCWQKPLANKM